MTQPTPPFERERFLELAREALPPVEGRMTVPGLRAPVTVRRDRWGVPHLRAESLADLYLAHGFVSAADRLFQIEMAWRASEGRLAELIGEGGLEYDRPARMLGRNHDHRWVAATLDQTSVEMWQDYLAGIHAFIEHGPALPAEYRLLDVAPTIPSGEDAPARMASLIARAEQGDWQGVLMRVHVNEQLGPEVASTLMPGWPFEPLGIRPGGTMPTGHRPGDTGSNAWAIAGSRTASGKPIVAYDPHLPFGVPMWTEVHLSAPGFEVAGSSHPGFPGVVAGHTDFHGWGITSGLGNKTELCLERLDDTGTCALYGDAWEPLVTRHEEIAVLGRSEPVVVAHRATRNGPIVDDAGAGHAYSVRFSPSDGTKPSVFHRMARARSWDQFREALRDVTFIHWNIVYADADGTIAHQLVGPWPQRRRGDGTSPAAGWLPAHDWDGAIAFDELPCTVNPAVGYVASANNRPVDESYPYALGRDFAPPWRIRRVTEVLANEPVHTVEVSSRLQADTVSVVARELAARLVRLEPSTDVQRRAVDLLRGWDGDLAVDSAAAALHQRWVHHLVDLVLAQLLGDELPVATVQAMAPVVAGRLAELLDRPPPWLFEGAGRDGVARAVARSLDLAIDELGPDPSAWRWGDHHRVEFRHPLAPDVVVGIAPIGGDGTVPGSTAHAHGSEVAGSGGVWRGVVDLADVDRSVGVITTGVSGNPASPHWADQFALWINGDTHPLPWTDDAVEQVTVARQDLLPG